MTVPLTWMRTCYWTASSKGREVNSLTFTGSSASKQTNEAKDRERDWTEGGDGISRKWLDSLTPYQSTGGRISSSAEGTALVGKARGSQSRVQEVNHGQKKKKKENQNLSLYPPLQTCPANPIKNKPKTRENEQKHGKTILFVLGIAERNESS